MHDERRDDDTVGTAVADGDADSSEDQAGGSAIRTGRSPARPAPVRRARDVQTGALAASVSCSCCSCDGMPGPIESSFTCAVMPTLSPSWKNATSPSSAPPVGGNQARGSGFVIWSEDRVELDWLVAAGGEGRYEQEQNDGELRQFGPPSIAPIDRDDRTLPPSVARRRRAPSANCIVSL